MRLTLLTAEPRLARIADAAGVDRIGIDIERLGKAERQASRSAARLSMHTLEDLPVLASTVHRARLFCRLDPPHAGSRAQVDRAIELGATCLLLPFFHTVAEATAFVDAVSGRAETILLVETAAAAKAIEPLAEIEGVGEIMIGLNDLSWDSGVASRFELLCHPWMTEIARAVRIAGKALAIGGVGRWDDASLPMPSDLIYAQYPRLGATGAWLARSFLKGLSTDDLADAVAAARVRFDHWQGQPPAVLEQARAELERAARASPL